MKRTARSPDQPLRDYPTYTIPEAAFFLGIPSRTLRYWLLDHPVWQIAQPLRSSPLLSFRDLAQAYYIELVRKHFQLTPAKVREVIEQASKESKAHFPLLQKNIFVAAKHVYMDKPAKGRHPRLVVDLTQHRQLAFPEIVEQFATRIEWDKHEELKQIFPWRHWEGATDERRPVTIDSNIMSGRLVVTGTRIPAQLVLVRAKKESVAQIAKDYELSADVIQQVLSSTLYKK